jgi:carotenoid isomerooxygenase
VKTRRKRLDRLIRFALRVSAVFTPGESISDNAMISVYPFGDELYAFTESPVIHRFDLKTLDTLDRVSESVHSRL